jgi:hypothetical protein
MSIRARFASGLALGVLLLLPGSADASFEPLPGAAGFDAVATSVQGGEERLAGAHPKALAVDINLTEGSLRGLRIDFPGGLIENPGALARCERKAFSSSIGCQEDSQVGIVTLGGSSQTTYPVYNLVAPVGSPSAIGFHVEGQAVVASPRIRDVESEYGLSLAFSEFPQQLELSGVRLELWGTPWSVVHDGQRGHCLNPADPTDPLGKCSVGATKSKNRLAYLTLPSTCSGTVDYGLEVTAWSGATAQRSASDPPLTSCDNLSFEPITHTTLTTNRTTTASGLGFEIEGDEAGLLNPSFRAASQAKKAVIELPEGVNVNPSVGAGLGACSAAQYAAEATPNPPVGGCPSDSKIGVLTLQSPLFEGEVKGGLYLARPDDPEVAGHENPFDSLIALYLVARSPQRGVLVRLAGRVEADSATGHLTATFDRLPQLPYSRFTVQFSNGQRAALATPSTCGDYSLQTVLNPWLAPARTLVVPAVAKVNSGLDEGPCPSGGAPFAPRSVAGSLNRSAGAYTPYYLHLTRTDADQEITSYSTSLPPGLLGRLKGIPFCPDSAIAAASQQTGFGELRDPTCPDASKIGHTYTGYGLGSVLAYAPGGLYLAGPYHGAPLSIVAVDSATVGPFDLGVVIIRSAIRIDPRTSQVSIDSAGSDPIPHILRGIPLHLRDIRVYIDRPGFMVNPTSCENFQATSTLSGSGADLASPADDSHATSSSHFQVGNCSAIAFTPKISFRLRGGTRRGAYPSLLATVKAKPGQANIAAATVDLPPSLFLAQEHIDTVCTQRQFAAEKCPSGSRYGYASARTPLLGRPLQGPVYLRSSTHSLPDLVADLSAGGIHIEVPGRIGHAGARIRASFEGLPDGAITSFSFSLTGGKNGLLTNSENQCAPVDNSVRVQLGGQNNAREHFRAKLTASCHAGKKKGKKR